MNPNHDRPTNATPDEGMPVAAGHLSSDAPAEAEQQLLAAALAAARQRFLAAALAEDGMPVGAGWVAAADARPRNTARAG